MQARAILLTGRGAQGRKALPGLGADAGKNLEYSFGIQSLKVNKNEILCCRAIQVVPVKPRSPAIPGSQRGSRNSRNFVGSHTIAEPSRSRMKSGSGWQSCGMGRIQPRGERPLAQALPLFTRPVRGSTRKFPPRQRATPSIKEGCHARPSKTVESSNATKGIATMA